MKIQSLIISSTGGFVIQRISKKWLKTKSYISNGKRKQILKFLARKGTIIGIGTGIFLILIPKISIDSIRSLLLQSVPYYFVSTKNYIIINGKRIFLGEVDLTIEDLYKLLNKSELNNKDKINLTQAVLKNHFELQDLTFKKRVLGFFVMGVLVYMVGLKILLDIHLN